LGQKRLAASELKLNEPALKRRFQKKLV
jgi:hypothetical protein